MKKFLLLFVAMTFVLSSAVVQAEVKPFTIYAGGGLTLPMSPDGLKDNYKSGYHLSGGLGFNAMPKVEVVLGLDYHLIPLDDGGDWDIPSADGGDISVILAGVDGKLNLGIPLTGLNPFFHAGLGLAVTSASDLTYLDPIDGLVTDSEDAENNFYFQIGGGLEFQKFFIKIRYVSIAGVWTDDNDNEEAVAMIPITIGIKF